MTVHKAVGDIMLATCSFYKQSIVLMVLDKKMCL